MKIKGGIRVRLATDTLKQSLRRGHRIEFDESRIREVLYRPFTKLWLYEDDRILSSVKTVSRMFGKMGGGLGRSLSPVQTIGPSSPQWPRSHSRTFARPGQTSHAELSPAADNADYRSHEPDDLRGDDNAAAGGPSRLGPFNQAASEKLVSDSPPILLVSQTQRLPFATLVTDRLFDLCVPGRQTRGAPREL